MITYAYDLYPSDDPKDGARIVRFTKRQEAQFLVERNGTGSGRWVTRSTEAEAQLIDPAGLQYVRIRRIHDSIVDPTTLSGFNERVVHGIFLDAFDYAALDKKRTRKLTPGGAGVLSILDRAQMWSHTYIGAAGELAGLGGGMDPYDDKWRLYAQGNMAGGDHLGSVLWRVIAEAMSYQAGAYTHRHADGELYTDTHDDDRLETAIGMITLTFDGFTDSDGNPWTLPSGQFTAAVGESVLQVVKRLMDAGLYVELDPDTFELRAWERANHGRDLTAAAWGTDVVRFQVSDNAKVARGNIKSDAKRSIAARIRRSRILAGGQDLYATAASAGATIPWEGFRGSNAEDVDALEQLAAMELKARDDAGDTARLRTKLGDAPVNGKYLPLEHYTPDDLVTLHSGASVWDWDELSIPVGGVNVVQRKNGGWDAFVDVGATYSSVESRDFKAESAISRPSGPTVRLCEDPACKDLTADDLTEMLAANGDAEDSDGGQWSGGAYQTSWKHSGLQSYGVAASADATLVYSFPALRLFFKGVRYVIDVWGHQGGVSVTPDLRFGKLGVDEVTEWSEPTSETIGADVWTKQRLCWIPSEDRTGVQFSWHEIQASADEVVAGDLKLYTANSEGRSPRAQRCDRVDAPRLVPAANIPYDGTTSGLAAETLQEAVDQVAAAASTGGASGTGSHAETIGDGAATSFDIVHNLNSEDVQVHLLDLTGANPVEASGDASAITVIDADTVRVAFGVAPALDAYRVVVLAVGGGGFYGASIRRLANLVIADATAFPFDTATDDPLGMWDLGDATKLTIPRTGWYWVGADITTLGTNYGGPNNQQVMIEVCRNWDGVEPHLDEDVVFERFWNKNGSEAHGNSTLQLVHLVAGDYLQLLLTGSGSGLLVESNPSDGLPSGYLTDTGPGTLSPHLYVVLADRGGGIVASEVAPLTVREVGGSDVANVDTLEFDADDFAVTGEGSGVVRVALTNAADPYHYEVMMADFGSGLEPMTDAAGDWLYGRYEGSLY